MNRSGHATHHGVIEKPTIAQTAVCASFTGMLQALDACVAAERQLQHKDSAIFAPSNEQNRAMADAAREDLMVRLDQLIGMAEALPMDRPLRQLALLLHILLSIEDDSDEAYMLARMIQNAFLFLVPRKYPMAQTVRHLQSRFYKGYLQLMAAQDFGGMSLCDGGCYEPALAA